MMMKVTDSGSPEQKSFTYCIYIIAIFMFFSNFFLDGWESVSMSEEEDDDGEWVNVHHSSDEDQEELVKL